MERVLRALALGGETAGGIAVTPTRAMQCATVFACIKVLSESFSQIPFKLFTKDGAGNRSPAEGHSLYSLLLEQPNEFMTSFEFREFAMVCALLRGNSFSQIIRTGRNRTVRELLPLHPDTVTIRRDSDWTIRFEVETSSGPVVLPKDEVLHFRGLSLDGLRGLTPISYIREAIGLALATERFGAQLFKNGAKPGGVITHPGKLSPEAVQRLRENWDGATSGENAHKTAVLEENSKWERMGMTSEDSQFLETRKYQRSEIASIYRVPSHMINDLERATFSNVEHLSLEFVKFSLMPWLVRFEQAAKRDLMTPEEKKHLHFRFLVNGLERGDIKSRSEAYATGRQWGWYSADDIRDLEEMNRLPDGQGQTYLVPMNMENAASFTEQEKEPGHDERKIVPLR